MSIAERPPAALLPPARVANLTALKENGVALERIIREVNLQRRELGRRRLMPTGLYDRHRPELDLVYSFERKMKVRGKPSSCRSLLVLPEDVAATRQALQEMEDSKVDRHPVHPSRYDFFPATVGIAKLVEQANQRRIKLGFAPLRPNGLLEEHPELKLIVRKTEHSSFVYVDETEGALQALVEIEAQRVYRTPAEAEEYCQRVLYPALAGEFKGKTPTQVEVFTWVERKAKKYLQRRIPFDEVEDLAQTALLKLLPYLTGREGIEKDADSGVVKILYRTCRNLICDYYRSKKSRQEVSLYENKDYAAKDTSEAFSGFLLPPQLFAKAGLTPLQKKVIFLRLVEDLSVEETVAALNGEDSSYFNSVNVRGLCYRGVLRLRQYLTSLGITGESLSF